MKKHSKLVLIGYMASGKSLIAEKLAAFLQIPWIDLDTEIEKHEKSSIPQIFKQKGEIYFRKLEHQLLQQTLEGHQKNVLSVGGGTPCYYHNMQLLNEHAHTVYLQASVPTLVERLQKEKAQRPLIAHLSDAELSEFVAKHLFERQVFYQQAHQVIKVDGKQPEEIIGEILN